MKRILFYSLAASAVFAVAVSSADAATRKHHPKGHYSGKTWRNGGHHRYSVDEPRRPFVRVAVDGVRIDRDGWRYWKSWDNTCFRTLDYLSSHSACTGGGP